MLHLQLDSKTKLNDAIFQSHPSLIFLFNLILKTFVPQNLDLRISDFRAIVSILLALLVVYHLYFLIDEAAF